MHARYASSAQRRVALPLSRSTVTQNPYSEADRQAQPPSTSAGYADDSASLDPSHHRALAETRRADGDELGAVAHLIAAHTLDAYAAAAPNASAANLCDVATGYFMKSDHEIAEYWYRLVLKLDPHVAVACQNLAAILAGSGRASEAAAYRERAYRIQRVFIEGSGAGQRRVPVTPAHHYSSSSIE